MDGSLVRAALGKVAFLGDLYDARSEKFCGASIVTAKPPKSAIRVVDDNVSNFQYMCLDTFLERFKKMDINAEQKLSILFGTLTPQGHGEYLTNEKKTARAVRSSLLCNIKTKTESLDWSSVDLKKVLSISALKNEEATHVVTEICWGANTIVTLESFKCESIEEDITEVQWVLRAALNKVSFQTSEMVDVDHNKVSEVEKDTNFSVRVFADVLPDGHLPQTIEEATELLQKLPTFLKVVNGGKGKPIQYRMVPICSLKHLLNESKFVKDPFVKQLNEEVIVRFVKVFDEMSVVKQQLNDLQNHMSSLTFCILEQDIHKVENITTEFSNAEENLRSQLAAKLVEVRSGKAEPDQLENVCVQFQESSYSPNNVLKILSTYHPVIENITFAQNLLKNRVTYIGLGSTLESEIITETGDVYILFFSEKRKQLDKQLWAENCDLFLSLIQITNLKFEPKQQTKFIAVDLTVNPEVNVPEPVGDATKICHYKNGTYINYDVLADHAAKKSLCLAFSTQQVELSINKPSKRAFLELPCIESISGLCPNENRQWNCMKCEELIEYGFDGYFYCSCGRGSAKTYVFKCTSENHKGGFVPFPENSLQAFLGKLGPLKHLNILLMGPSGVGKSTWINGIVNYMTFDTLEDAVANGDLVSVIATSFTLTDNDFNEHTITVGNDKNEVNVVGQSATQDPRTYTFEMKGTLVHLIDTLGIGDTRGIDQDRKNVDRILKYIANYKELHAICILLKPNNSRIGVEFRFCLKELLKHLHKNASQNIVFCFTNARSTFYKPGQTLTILKKLLEEMKLDVPIVLAKPTVYCMDNEAFRFLCTLHYGIKYEPEDYKSYAASWDKSVVEIDRMFGHIVSLPPHFIQNTTSLNDARYIILGLTESIAEISRNIQTNIAVVKDRKREVENTKQNEEELASRLYMPEIVLDTVPLGYPRTLCANSNCVKYHKQGNLTVTEYVTHCHSPCGLTGVATEYYPNKDLQHCSAMNEKLICRFCNHDWKQHMHLMNELKHEQRQVINNVVQNEMNQKKSAREKIQQNISDLENRVIELENEQRIITEASAKFGHFLKANAIVPYNDALKDYLHYLIEQEEGKANKTDDRKTLEGLKMLMLTYESEVKILSESMNSSGHSEPLTPDDIKNLEKELYSLPINGEQLRKHMAVTIAAKAGIMSYTQHYYKPKQYPKSKQAKQVPESMHSSGAGTGDDAGGGGFLQKWFGIGSKK